MEAFFFQTEEVLTDLYSSVSHGVVARERAREYCFGIVGAGVRLELEENSVCDGHVDDSEIRSRWNNAVL